MTEVTSIANKASTYTVCHINYTREEEPGTKIPELPAPAHKEGPKWDTPPTLAEAKAV